MGFLFPLRKRKFGFKPKRMGVSVMAKNLIGSEIIKIGGEVNDMIRKGEKICNLTIGDFNPAEYPIPSYLQNGISKAYTEGHTNYPPADGVLELRTAALAFVKNRLGLNYQANEVLVAGGSRPLIYATYLTLVDAGDKVVFPTPSWNNNHYCHLSGADPVMIETYPENNFMPRAADIAPHLRGASLLALCSPLNPTGTVFGKKDLLEICDLVIAENKLRTPQEKPLYILYDHIYWMLTFGDTQHFDPVSLRPELRDYVIYIDGISKSFAATGVRVGFAYGPERVISRMKSILGHVGAWAPKAEQIATARFLDADNEIDAYMNPFKKKIQASLDLLYTGFKAMKDAGHDVDAVAPMGAIYLTVKVNVSGKKTPQGDILITSKDINSYFIHKAGWAMVPFSAFGASENTNWFRLSVGGCSLADISAALPRFQKALEALR